MMMTRIAVSLLMVLVTSLLGVAYLYWYQYKRLNKWYRKGRKQKADSVHFKGFIHLKWRNWLVKRLVQAGEPPREAKKRAQIWELIMVIGFLLVQWQAPLGWLSGLIWLLGLLGGFWMITAQQIRVRQIGFATGVYKLYRALSLQLTAGMTVTSSLKQLHETVDEPFLKEAMHAYSTRYFQTMDLDRASEELVNRIGGPEVQILVAVLKQGITTGDHYALLKKQEQVMLRRFYGALESETEMIRRRTIMIAIGLCILVFLLLALPLLYEMSRATANIFSY